MTDAELFARFLQHVHDRGWTFEEAAKAIGVSRATLFNWQAGGNISSKGRAAIGIFIDDIRHPSDPLLDYVNGAWPDLTAEEKAEVVAVIERSKEKKDAIPAADNVRET